MTTILRQVPADTPVHRLWAGTKLVCVAALAVVMSFYVSWTAIGLAAALVVVTAAVGRVGPSVVPRPRPWLYAVVAGGVMLSYPADGWSAVLLSVRLLVLTLVLLGSALLVGWTTPLGDVAPALARLFAPLRFLRVPVEEWAATVALCLRALPLLFEEARVMGASRRLRRNRSRNRAAEFNEQWPELLAAAMAMAMRRSGELAEAVTARGGWGRVSADVARPGWRDVIALLITAAVCAAIIVLG